jgi:hypothetical protein
MRSAVPVRVYWGPLVAMGLAAAVACQPDASPVSPGDVTALGSQGKPGDPGAASERMFFQARLEPERGSRVRGIVQFEVVGGHFTAKLRATGLEPLQSVPQHIHVNPTCDPAGGILINLDSGLTVAGEGPGFGPAFPQANRGGVVQYRASRSLADLMDAANEFLDAGVETVDEFLAWLNLASRNVNVHEPPPPPIPSVGCGEIRRVN